MTLLCIQSYSRPVFDTNFWGQSIYPKEALAFVFEIRCELQMPERKLPFLVLARVLKTLQADKKKADSAAFSWLAQELPGHFSNQAYWDFFGYNKVDVEQLTEHAPTQQCDVTLSSAMQTRAQEACTELAGIEEKFQDAKSRLSYLASNNYPLGFKQSLHEARDLFRTLETVLDASATLGGDTAGHARSAQQAYQELASRQVESNANYQRALTTLKRFAYGVSFPEVWSHKPRIAM